MKYFSDWKIVKLSKITDIPFLRLSALVIFGAIFEMLGVALIFPLLGLIQNTEFLYNYSTQLKQIFSEEQVRWLGSPINFSFLVLLIFLLCNLVKITCFWVQLRSCYKVGAHLADKAFDNILSQSYEKSYKMNSTDILADIWNKSNSVVINYLIPIFNAIASSTIVLIILISLMIVDFYATIIAALYIVFFYFVIATISKNILSKLRSAYNVFQNIAMKDLKNGFGFLKEVHLYNQKKFYVETFSKNNIAYRQVSANIQLVSSIPRYLLEIACVSLIIILFLTSYILLKEEVSNEKLIFFGIALVRIAPAFQSIYTSWVAIMTSGAIVESVLSYVEVKRENFRTTINSSINPIQFKDSITLKNLKYKYSDNDKYTLKNFNLKIKKGEWVALTGATGTGKTTLTEVMLGLFQLNEGNIFVDDKKIDFRNIKSFRELVGYVPQNVFLCEDTIVRNIFLGNLDSKNLHSTQEENFWKVMKILDLEDLVKNLPDKENTVLGENGISFSGGQRQRLGIARSIIRTPELLILDEATSALDENTENRVLSLIRHYYPQQTCLFITHRKNTLKHCDRTVELEILQR